MGAVRVPRQIAGALAAMASLAAFVLVPAIAGAHPGDLDPSFGAQGLARVKALGDSSAGRLAVMPDDRLVVTGRSGDALIIVRLGANGSLDETFGDDGVLALGSVSGGDRIYEVAPMTDGRIVLLGRNGTRSYVARLLSDGRLDPSFSEGGVVATDARIQTLELQSDGRILLASEEKPASVVRLTSAGELDPTFGGSGVAPLPERLSPAEDLTVDPAGRIVGTAVAPSTDPYTEGLATVGAFRMLSDGSVDRSFADGGVHRSSCPRGCRQSGIEAGSVFARPDGGIVYTALRSYNSGFAVSSLRTGTAVTASGETDPGFFGDEAGDFPLYPAIDSEGRFVGARFIRGSKVDRWSLGLVRHLANGTVDTGFGRGGVANVNPSDGDDDIAHVAVQSTGRIVAVGEVNGRWAVAGFHSGPGARDADADSILDRDDRCARAAGVDGAGCPVYGPPRIVLETRGKHDRLGGFVGSKHGWCGGISTRPRLYFARKGADVPIGRAEHAPSDTENASGFRFEGGFRPGRYYVTTNRIFDSWVGVCRPGRSGSIRIDGRSGRG